jgi:hypothetical protein
MTIQKLSQITNYQACTIKLYEAVIYKMDKFCNKLVCFLLPVTNIQVWTNTLACNKICRLRILNFLIEQAPDGYMGARYVMQPLLNQT